MAIKRAAEFTERLDKIAEEVEKFNPALALQLDMISDVLEGKRSASTLQFDSDEAEYMQGRFNNNVRKRDSDEEYMDDFNKSDFEQVKRIKESPVPVRKASFPYQRVAD